MASFLHKSRSLNLFKRNFSDQKFKWNIPAKFNFAQDIIDAHATSKEVSKNTALHHVSETKGTRTWTFEELSNDSKKYASGLKNLGQLNRALIILPRIPEWWILNIAAMRIGLVLLPGTTQLTSNDISSRLAMSGADTIIVDETGAEKVELIEHKTMKNVKHKIIVSDNQLQNWTSFKDIIEADDNPACPEHLETSSDEIMQIFFTSGTTGAPKMCAHSQASYGFCHWVTAKHWLDLTPNDLHWNISDTGWAKSAWSNIFAPWSQASGVFIHDMPRFESFKVLQTLHDFPITTLCAPPTLYRSLIQDQDLGKFKTLRHCVSAGEPLNEEVIHTWHGKTGIWIREGYGQTETTLIACTSKNMKVKPGSMGKAAPGYDVKIIDENANEVKRGQEGNIAVLCHPGQGGLFSGYVNNEKMTRQALLNDFYLTGDRGYMDEDDYIWFSSRKDDVIISAGYRIGPFEVESALLKHPAVLESAVVPSPDPSRGHVVKAFVVLSESYHDKEDKLDLIKELQGHVKKTTAPYKYPRKIEFVQELPKTVSGKIKRAELRKKEFSTTT